jgi:hypothetical protein
VRLVERLPVKKPKAPKIVKQAPPPAPKVVNRQPPPKPLPREIPPEKAYEPHPMDHPQVAAPDAPNPTEGPSQAPDPGHDASAGGTTTGSPTGGSNSGGPSGPVDLGKVRLFDHNALGRSVQRWNASQPNRSDFMAAHAGDDQNDPIAEQSRIGGRMAAAIKGAQTEGRVAGGLISSCNDGIDQGLDGYMDCADPTCRSMPACKNTLEYSNMQSKKIPDDNVVGVSTEITVPEHGTIRTISIRVELTHPSPGDISLEIEHLPSGKKMQVKLADKSNRFFMRAYHLTDFIGEESAGVWILHVRDVFPSYTGNLREWHLYVTH